MLSAVLRSSSRRLVQSRQWFTLQQAQASVWTHVPKGPADPILGLTVMYNEDPNPKKVSLGVGAYRTDEGKPYVLQAAREAEKRIQASNANMEYAGIDGVPSFVKLARDLAFGEDHPLVKEKLIVSTQTLSGTGALRVATDFIARFLPKDHARTIYLPKPTWPNHKNVIKDSGLNWLEYRYYKTQDNSLDYEGLLQDIHNAPNGSVFMFHACAHNPTGLDPTLAQWSGISQACKEKSHVIFFDSAYQGFASGDPTADSQSYKIFLEDGHQIILAQSFAKNMGLYGHRVGALHFTCKSKEEADNVSSQVKILIRPMYSNPPIHGARIVAEILGDANLNAHWRVELKGMADRIDKMRHSLVAELKAAGSTKDWGHVITQIGMFCYTGLTPEQVDRLRTEQSIYMTRDGRISMAGLTSANIGYVARGIHEVTK